MIAKLIQWCVHNKLVVLILAFGLVAGGVWSTFTIKLDAIPDLSDVQVIVFADYAGQSPQVVEDQVTYPLAQAMLAVPKAKYVRGVSMFGASFVYVIFEDGTDLYWARSRVQEQLSFASSELKGKGVTPYLGPDATGVGWVYQYVLTTGPYCAAHPQGLWHDAHLDRWYAKLEDAPPDVRSQLVHHRIFPQRRSFHLDRDTNIRYGQPAAAPDDVRGRLVEEPLAPSDQSLADLRTIQDWRLRYELKAVEGVSEVASAGGFQKQYQVTLDPNRLLAFGISAGQISQAIQKSNVNVGGRVVELSEREYAVQGVGYLGTLSEKEIAAARAAGRSLEEVRTQKVLEDLRRVPLGLGPDGSPIRLTDVADVRLGPEMRRGIIEWNGAGETVGGIVVMRHGENARTTIQLVRKRLAEIQDTLPPGVAIDVGYDRSDLIDRAVDTLKNTLIEEITVVALVCIFFLLHARSELVAVIVVPTGVLASLLAMNVLGINANLMSLGGIAIAIGVMVDSSIVMVENAHKHLDREEERLHAASVSAQPAVPRPRELIITEAAREVGPSLFFSLLILTVSFLPIFVLGEQSGRMFKPLAYTKTFAMAAASFLAVTLVPVLMALLISSHVLPKRWGWKANTVIILLAMFAPAAAISLLPVPLGPLEAYRFWVAIAWAVVMGMLLVPQKIIHERSNPISHLLQWAYNPFFALVMRAKVLVIILAVAAVASVFIPFKQLGEEFMPPLEEGDLLYMPTTDPGVSMSKARELLQHTDQLIMQFPEVVSVMGKAGRAETPTDPAPVSMLESTIILHRDKSRWRHVPVRRFYSDWPDWARWLPSKVWKDTRPITTNELIMGIPDKGIIGLDGAVQVPGLTNSWTAPIRTRIDMLSTGIKTPVGLKFMGSDLAVLSDLAQQAAKTLQSDPRTAGYTQAEAEKAASGYYVDITPNRDQLNRYQLSVQDVMDVIGTAVGGMPVTQTVEGRERYTVNVRYHQDYRDDIPAMQRILVDTPAGPQVPLGQLADLAKVQGPDIIRSENARLTAWVYVSIAGIDVGTYVEQAKQVLAEKLPLPQGYSLVWSGQYEYMEAARAKLSVVIPMVAIVIVLLLYLATKSWLQVWIVLLAVPFSLVGAFWLLYILDYNLSLAVWVGVIALAGLDAETGIVMLLYLNNSFDRFSRGGRMRNTEHLWQAVHEGAVKRIRPKTMTVATTFIGLLPLMWATGAGADTMRRLAAPMIGGLATSFIMELLIYPVIFASFKEFQAYTGWSDNRIFLLVLTTGPVGLVGILFYNAARRRGLRRANGVVEFPAGHEGSAVP